MFVGSVNGAIGYVPNPAGKGISAYRVDLESGAAEFLTAATDVVNPTFAAVAPDGKSLLSVSELPGAVEGRLSGFSLDAATGKLTLRGQVGTRGWTPAHLSFDGSGRYAAAINYGDAPPDQPGASVVVVERTADGASGRGVGVATPKGSGPNAGRQSRPHAHCVRWTPDNRFVVVADLGIDALVVYRFDAASGAIVHHRDVKTTPGAGPRHFVFHPNGRFVYVANELSCTVASFAFDAADASFRMIGEVSSLPATTPGNSCSAIQISANGAHVFVGNRGHDSVARLAVDANGVAQFIGTTPCGGKVPRDFAFDPSGRVLAVANQGSDVISLFRYDPKTGDLQPLGAPISSGSPTAIAFHPVLG
jgi:6-phosphogluconolactonase